MLIVNSNLFHPCELNLIIVEIEDNELNSENKGCSNFILLVDQMQSNCYCSRTLIVVTVIVIGMLLLLL